jgi:hypothetical protein
MKEVDTMKDKLVAVYEDGGCLAFILVLLLCMGLVFGIYCLQGWIFLLLWNWLAVSLLNAPALGYWVCVGIVLALSFLGRIIFGRSSSNKD